MDKKPKHKYVGKKRKAPKEIVLPAEPEIQTTHFSPQPRLKFTISGERNYLLEYQSLNQNYSFSGNIQNMLRRMTKDKNILCKEPVYAWSKNIVEVLLLNEIQIAHWCVLMKKLHWTPPTMFSLYDILLFTAFTAKQYYCHPNEFPVYTFKIDNDRPGFVMMHSRWAKQNSITLRAWEVNKKFNKLKIPLENYNQASFGAELIQRPKKVQEDHEDHQQQLQIGECEGDIVIVHQTTNETQKQNTMEDDIEQVVRQLKLQSQPVQPPPPQESQRKSENKPQPEEEKKTQMKKPEKPFSYVPDKSLPEYPTYNADCDSLNLNPQPSYQDMQEIEMYDDIASVQHEMFRDKSFR